MVSIDNKLSQTFSFRMNNLQKEILDKISKEFDGLTGRKLVFKLIEHYEANKDKSQSSSEFTLTMIMHKRFLDHDDVSPLKKIVFFGSEYYSHPGYYYQLTANIAQQIKEDFNFELYGLPDDYVYYDTLDLYYHNQEKSFLIHERLGVELRQNSDNYCDNLAAGIPPCPFYVERCQFVRNYQDLYSKFSRYASYDNLQELRRHVAEDIGTDYAQMDMFFKSNRESVK